MRLEKYKEDDEALYSQLVFNEETMKMNLGRVFTEAESKLFFRAMLGINAAEPVLGFYKVFAMNEGRDVFIGMGALTRSEEHDAAEIEYMLLPQYWNRGYGSELAGDLIRMAEEAKPASGIVAITDPANKYSKKILLKHGFYLLKQYPNDDGEQVELYYKKI